MTWSSSLVDIVITSVAPRDARSLRRRWYYEVPHGCLPQPPLGSVPTLHASWQPSNSVTGAKCDKACRNQPRHVLNVTAFAAIQRHI